MPSCAITGVSGNLGQLLLEALGAEPEVSRIVGIDLRPPPAASPKLAFHRLDVRDPALADLLRRERVDSVLHLAFVLNPIHDARLMHDINLNGTRNVLRAVAGAGTPQLIAFSSVAAYGAWPDNPVPLVEESPLRPNPDFQYAVDKAAIDRLCRDFAADQAEVAVAIVRPTFVLGRHVENYFTRYLRHWPALPVVRGGDGPMQFVHEDDLAALCLALLRQQASGVYNLAGDGTLRWSEVIRRAGRRPVTVPASLLFPFNDALWRMRMPFAGAPSGQIHFTRYPYTMSTAKAKRELGFQARFSAAQALEALVRGWPPAKDASRHGAGY